MQLMCAYELVALGGSEFCALFTSPSCGPETDMLCYLLQCAVALTV